MSLKAGAGGCCRKVPFVDFGGAKPPLLLVLCFEREEFGAVGKWEACLWLSTLSTAAAFPLRSHRGLRHRVNKLSLAFCIRRAASMSLLAVACCWSMAGVIAAFRDFSHFGRDVSFS